MNLDGSAVLHADPERVWSVITDPAVLARTIPGCLSLEQVAEDSYRALWDTRLAFPPDWLHLDLTLGDWVVDEDVFPDRDMSHRAKIEFMLERQGWAARHAHPDDRRMVLATLTPKGVEVLTAATAAARAVSRACWRSSASIAARSI